MPRRTSACRRRHWPSSPRLNVSHVANRAPLTLRLDAQTSPSTVPLSLILPGLPRRSRIRSCGRTPLKSVTRPLPPSRAFMRGRDRRSGVRRRRRTGPDDGGSRKRHHLADAVARDVERTRNFLLAQVSRTFRDKSTLSILPPSLSPERAKTDNFYAASRSLIRAQPRSSMAPTVAVLCSNGPSLSIPAHMGVFPGVFSIIPAIWV